MLNSTQTQNAKALTAEMLKEGITNKDMQTAILGIAYKESGLNPSASEVSYATTSNDRIRSIFKNAKALSDAQISALKANPVSFFNAMYNGIIGNGPTDGYLFRGRGFNQLTGRANYANYSKKIGKDIVSNPDYVSTPEGASKVLVEFFKSGIDTLKRLGKFTGKDINDVPDLKTAYNAVYNINAGAGKNLYDHKGNIKADTTGGYTKGINSLDWISKNIIGAKDKVVETAQQATEVVKKNPLKTIFITAGIVIIIYTAFKLIKKNL